MLQHTQCKRGRSSVLAVQVDGLHANIAEGDALGLQLGLHVLVAAHQPSQLALQAIHNVLLLHLHRALQVHLVLIQPLHGRG